jgi:septation ring formation regulator EzrA
MIIIITIIIIIITVFNYGTPRQKNGERINKNGEKLP